MRTLISRTQLLLPLLVLGVFAFFTSCDRDTPAKQTKLLINPQTVEIHQDETLQLTLKEDGKDVTAESWSVKDATIAEISSTGLLKALAQGSTEVTATYKGRTVKSYVTVLAKELQPETYIMPYLRFFDGVDAIKEYELAQGHKLTAEDPAMGYVAFKTRSTLMPEIGYIVGERIQIMASVEVLKSKEFLAFMKEHGFDTTGQVEAYGMMLFTTTKYKTVTAASIISIEGYPTGMTFSVKAPVLEKWDMPYLDFAGTEANVASFEQKRNYPQINTRTKGDYKEIHYGTLKEGPEYDDLNVIKYLFKAGKLVKVTHLMAPNRYAIISMGDGFDVVEPFKEMIKNKGYTQERIKEGTENYVVYTLADKHKFTFEQWSLKVKNKTYNAAGIAYVPLTGPNKIESPEF